MKGYDNLDINRNLVLDLSLREGSGIIARDESKSRYQLTLSGPPAWTQLASGKNVLTLNPATPDFLQAAIASVPNLDFTTQDFSFAIWLSMTSLASSQVIINHGSLPPTTSGYSITFATGTNTINFTSQQFPGMVQQQWVWTAANSMSLGYHLIGIRRVGADVKIIIDNGEPGYSVKQNIGNPQTNVQKFLVGVANNETSNPLNGTIGRVRVWRGRALTINDFKYIWNSERHLYGV